MKESEISPQLINTSARNSRSKSTFSSSATTIALTEINHGLSLLPAPALRQGSSQQDASESSVSDSGSGFVSTQFPEFETICPQLQFRPRKNSADPAPTRSNSPPHRPRCIGCQE